MENYGKSKKSEAAPKKTQRKLYLKLTCEQRAETLRLLSKTPGNICVVLHMAEEKKTYQAPEEYWVNDKFDFVALTELLGDGNVVLK